MWDKLKEQFNLLKLEKKKLYMITDSEKFVTKDEFLDAVASALQGGVDIIQLRENIIPDKVIVELGHKIRTLCDEYGATFIVNNRSDIAKIVDADGVHLGNEDIEISDAREVLGSNTIVGKTTHNLEEIKKAINQGADYITYGPITLNKKDFTDFETIEWVKNNTNIPIFITGNIDINNVPDFVNNGVSKIALSDQIIYSRIPEQTARTFLKYLP